MWKLQAIIIKKEIPKKEAKQHAEDIAIHTETGKDKLNLRETGDSYRFSVFNKKLFNEFRTKILNDNISLVFGKLIKKEDKEPTKKEKKEQGKHKKTNKKDSEHSEPSDSDSGYSSDGEYFIHNLKLLKHKKE